MLIYGDCQEEMKELPDNSIDSVVTDPPYGLSKEPDIMEVLTKWMNGEDYKHISSGFMGKSWDSFVPGPAIWREVYRVLKPGGHILCFAGTRTQDLMTISLRLAGFEVRDVIEWLYLSGFPKSMDIGKQFDKLAGAKREIIGPYKYDNRRKEGSGAGFGDSCYGDYGRAPAGETAPATELAKQYDGWGTALKPSHEPILLCRKPIVKTVAYNVEKYGTGGLNIDGCRIDYESNDDLEKLNKKNASFHMLGGFSDSNIFGTSKGIERVTNEKGRFPANCITLDDDVFYSKYFNITPAELSKKASKKDRNSDWKGEEITIETIQPVRFASENGSGKMLPSKKSNLESHKVKGNFHPTCKPTFLMSWLIRLITPPGGIVLDPFAGSGSTLVAAKREGFKYIGIEKEAEYIEIVNARIGGVLNSENNRYCK